MKFIIILFRGSGIDIDEDSFENLVYNNTMTNITDLSEVLYLRDGAPEQNTLHSNTLIGMNGQRISLDELEITEGAEDSSEKSNGSNINRISITSSSTE